MTEELIQGIEDEKEGLVGKLNPQIGDSIKLSNPMEGLEVAGFVTRTNPHKLTISVENPENPPIDKSREFVYKNKVDYDLGNFTKSEKLVKTMEEIKLTKKLDAEYGDFIQFSNTKRNLKLRGYFISKKNGSFTISVENPHKSVSSFLPSFKYKTKYFKYYNILNKSMEDNLI